MTIEEQAGPYQSQTAKFGLLDLFVPVIDRWKLLLGVPLTAGVLAYVAVSFMSPYYTAKALLLPPQQQQSAAAAALQSLGALAGVGGLPGSKSPAEQYVALMRSATVSDKLIDKFDLLRIYGVGLRTDGRGELSDHTRIDIGKRDGLISIEVDDHDPKRAQVLANAYIAELKSLTNTLAMTEAQQRRLFFESQLKQTRAKLDAAEAALQGSGVSPGLLKAEPLLATSNYAKLQADISAAEVRLSALKSYMTDASPEVVVLSRTIQAMRAKLHAMEAEGSGSEQSAYLKNYREVRYQKELYELLAKQYEAARVDEAKDGAIIQVVDYADVPDKRSGPRRGLAAVTAAVVVWGLLLFWVVAQSAIAGAMAADAVFRARVVRAASKNRLMRWVVGQQLP